VRRSARAGLLALALVTAACTGGSDDAEGSTTTGPTATTGPGTTLGPPVDDGPPLTTAAESLVGLMLTADDLPPGFAPSDDVDDTVTTFCAGQDATAGLRATAREVVGFTRTPAGASVIQVTFRFADDGATAFVDQAEALLEGCDEVPDGTGLAFTYEPVSPTLTTALATTDASASRYGTSFGSGNLTVNVAAFRQGDIGQLVAVLGLEQDRAELDTLAEAAFSVAAERPNGP
jgi:hypothetical protein